MINIHQAIYGELESAKGYHLLDSSFKDSTIARRLSNITDLIDRPPNSILSEPVFRGFAVEEYYLFIKTFPDLSTTVRSGRVFSHVLIVKLSDLNEIKNLKSVLECHIKSVNKEIKLDSIQFETSILNQNKKDFDSPQLASAINGVVNHSEFDNTVVWIGEAGYIDWINKIWSNIPNLVKPNIKLGIAYDPQKVDKTILNLIYIPDVIRQNWVNYNFKIIDKDRIEVFKTQTACLLAGDIQKAEELNNLVNGFELQIKEIDDLLKLERVLPSYTNISEAKELRPILIFADIISKFSYKTSIAKDRKADLLRNVISKFKYATSKEIIALPNIDWSGYTNYEPILTDSLYNWLDKELFSNSYNNGIAKILEKVYSANHTNWWNRTIKKVLNERIHNWKEGYIISVINWFNYSPLLIEYLEPILPNYVEDDFTSNIEKIDSTIQEKLLNVAKTKKWSKFHASILAELYLIEDAIKFQLELELDNFEGLDILASYYGVESLINYTSQNPINKLVDFSIKLIEANPELLSEINVSNQGWIDIWAICEKQNISAYNYVSDPIKLTYSTLDEIINGKSIEEFLLDKISKSNHNDLTNYPNRSELWDLINLKTKTNFIQSTSSFNDLEKVLLINQIVESENELKKNISIVNYVEFLIGQTDDLIFKKLFVLFETFNLNESVFLNYIGRKPKLFGNEDCKRIGYLILKKRWYRSYKVIKTKILVENRSFQFTIEIINKDFFFRLGFGRKDNNSPIEQSSVNSKSNMSESLPVIVILTAINEEYKAVRNHLIDVERVNRDDTIYESGIFELAGNRVAVVIIRECGPKNNIAAQETERAINNFKPNGMFFVGIAGSRKVNDFKVGDVIYPEKIYSYEAGKSGKDSFSARPDLGVGTYAVSEMAKIERNNNDWKNLIKGGFDTQEIKADLGVIASGEQIVEHYDSDIGQILTEYYNDTSAVEMEGFGFAKAAERQGRSKNGMLIGVVRGISDVLEREGDSTNLEETDRRPDNAKILASNTAAAFTYWLIFNLFENV